MRPFRPRRIQTQDCLLIAGILQAGLNIGLFQVGEFINDLVVRHSDGKQIKYIAYTDAHATHARLATALQRIVRDSIF
jgi:hypothetical protein